LGGYPRRMLLWVLLWVVLILGAGAVLGLLGWRLWQKLRALTTEVGEASERLTAVLASLNDLSDAEGQPAPRAMADARSSDRRARPH
jgi:ketopantoate reductase